MENNIEILENIMKPYFDKKREIEGAPATLEKDKESTSKEIHDLKNARISRRKELEVELENLRVEHKIAIQDFEEKQEKEISEYINQLIDSNPALSSTYISFIRSDLEQQYNKKLKNIEKEFDLKEEQIVSEIKLLKSVSEEEKNEKQNLQQLNNKLDYSRVDLRELVEIKNELRKKLFAERKRLNSELLDLKLEYELYEKTSLELKEKQLNYIEVMDKLSNFKYEYNDQNQVVNSDEWRKLYEESNLISKEIQDLTKYLSQRVEVVHKLNDVNKSLEKVEEYIKLTELTKEETAAVMMSMTPWEREEYDRRKASKNSHVSVEDIPKLLNPYSLELEPKENKEDKLVSSKVEFQDLFDVAYNEIKEEEKQKLEDAGIYDAEYIEEENDTVVDNVEDNIDDLYTDIYDDILKEIDTMKTVRMVLDEGLTDTKRSFEIKENSDQSYEKVGVLDTRLNPGDTIELPSGEFLNENDVIEGIEKLYNKNEQDKKTYVVEGSKEESKFSQKYINKIKRALKKYTALKLVKEKTLQNCDLIRVHGKEKIKKLFKKFNVNLAVEKNTGKTYEGNYIEKEDVIKVLGKLINKKAPYWTRKILDKLKEDKTEKTSKTIYDLSLEETPTFADEMKKVL